MTRDATIFPAGRRMGGILFFNRTAPARDQIFTMLADGTNVKQLTYQGQQYAAQLELEVVAGFGKSCL